MARGSTRALLKELHRAKSLEEAGSGLLAKTRALGTTWSLPGLPLVQTHFVHCRCRDLNPPWRPGLTHITH